VSPRYRKRASRFFRYNLAYCWRFPVPGSSSVTAKQLLTHSLTHSLDRLIGDGLLRRSSKLHYHYVMFQPESALSPTSTSSCSPDPFMSRSISRTLPIRPIIGSVTCAGTDRQTKFRAQEQTLADDIIVSKHRGTNSAADRLLFVWSDPSAICTHLTQSPTAVFQGFFANTTTGQPQTMRR